MRASLSIIVVGLMRSELCSEYGDNLRQELRNRDTMTDESKTEMLKQIDDFRKKSKMQIPDIERTIIKLSEQPREAGLWARLIQRVAGWGLGVAQARTLPPTLQWYQGLRHCHSASTISALLCCFGILVSDVGATFHMLDTACLLYTSASPALIRFDPQSQCAVP